MDPYVVVSMSGMTQQTKACYSAGKTPVWNEFMKFTIKSNDERIYLTVKDSDWFSDSFIGETAIPVYEFLGKNSVMSVNRWFSITFKGQPAGRVMLWSKY